MQIIAMQIVQMQNFWLKLFKLFDEGFRSLLAIKTTTICDSCQTGMKIGVHFVTDSQGRNIA